ncbi:MAG: hypothetical protein HY430_00790 [Candidatus Levybacteria bacterium]|nr:hypothetical protein [Candidatus Levybacteria bacterium]
MSGPESYQTDLEYLPPESDEKKIQRQLEYLEEAGVLEFLPGFAQVVQERSAEGMGVEVDFFIFSKKSNMTRLSFSEHEDLKSSKNRKIRYLSLGLDPMRAEDQKSPSDEPYIRVVVTYDFPKNARPYISGERSTSALNQFDYQAICFETAYDGVIKIFHYETREEIMFPDPKVSIPRYLRDVFHPYLKASKSKVHPIASWAMDEAPEEVLSPVFADTGYVPSQLPIGDIAHQMLHLYPPVRDIGENRSAVLE